MHQNVIYIHKDQTHFSISRHTTRLHPHTTKTFTPQNVRHMVLHEVSTLWKAVPALTQPMCCLALRAMAGAPPPCDEAWLAETTADILPHLLLQADPVPETGSVPAVLGAASLLQSEHAWPLKTTASGAACTAAALLAARRCEGYAEQGAIMTMALSWLVSTEAPSTRLPAVPAQLPPRYALLRAGLRWLLARPHDEATMAEAVAAAVSTMGDPSTLPDERAMASVVILQSSWQPHHWAEEGRRLGVAAALNTSVAHIILESYATTASRDRRNAAGEPVCGSSFHQRFSSQPMSLDTMLLSMVNYPYEQLAWPRGVPVPGVIQGVFVPLHAHCVAALAGADGAHVAAAFQPAVAAAIAKDSHAAVHAAAEVVAGVLSAFDAPWALEALSRGVCSNEHGEAWAAAARFVLATTTQNNKKAVIQAILKEHIDEGGPTWALQRRLSLLEGLLQECASPALHAAATTLLQRVGTLSISAGVRAPFAALLVRLCGLHTTQSVDENQVEDAELDAVVVAPPTADALLAASLEDVQTMCAVAAACKHATASLRRDIALRILQRLLALQEATANEGSVVQMEARAALVVARYVPFFSTHEANAALDAVRAVVESSSSSQWAPRAAAVVFLQTLAFRCAPLLDERGVLEVARTALRDAHTEVRDAACTTLSGVLAMGRVRAREWLLSGDTADVLALQGVLARRALVAAWPYDVPPWMPAVLMELSRAASGAKDVKTRESAKNALRESARTHEEQQRSAVRAALGGEDVFAVDGGGYFV